MSEFKGLRIVITRPEDQAGSFQELLENRGAETVLIPAIEISFPEDTLRLDRALSKLACYDWLVLTSVNGVEAVWNRLAALGIERLPEDLGVAAIGPKTAGALRDHGVGPDFVPDEYVAEAILPGLGDLNGRWVLLPRADLARPALARLIEESGGFAHEIAAYHTLPGHLDDQAFKLLEQGVDMLTFTSSSTVRNFSALVEEAGLNPRKLTGNPRVACIGPITADTAREMGYRVDLVADEYTIEGLTAAMAAGLKEEM
jgi:uroporphyrinogen-III synthase